MQSRTFPFFFDAAFRGRPSFPILTLSLPNSATAMEGLFHWPTSVLFELSTKTTYIQPSMTIIRMDHHMFELFVIQG